MLIFENKIILNIYVYINLNLLLEIYKFVRNIVSIFWMYLILYLYKRRVYRVL